MALDIVERLIIQPESKIEITRFTSITVWGSDRVRHKCASNKVTNDY